MEGASMIAAAHAYSQNNLLPDLAVYASTCLPPSYSCAQISKHDHFLWLQSLASARMLTLYDSIMTNIQKVFLDFKEILPHSNRQISK
jgi:hypothetical protein